MSRIGWKIIFALAGFGLFIIYATNAVAAIL
jgi:hypothetical protein